MKNYINKNYTLNNSSRKASSRPKSAAKRHFDYFKKNFSSNVPPPIIASMPNNPNKMSGVGNKIEREQLYENNMHLKDIINKLRKELAETKNQIVKKDLEIRKKEKIIKECSKENDLESVHEMNLEKARESTLVSLCKDKYNEIKNKYMKKCEENEILKANIKITKLKEYKIHIDVLKNEMEKIRALYFHTLEENIRLKKENDDYQLLKNKYMEQHNIINNLAIKCNQYNNEINSLKEEKNFLEKTLEDNIRSQKNLKRANVKLKISNKKYLINKKEKENNYINSDDNKKMIRQLKKDLKEYKKLYDLKNVEFNRLVENNKKMKDLKNKNEKPLIKPFDYNQIKVIENKKEDNNSIKLNLYKNLLEESRHKNQIYEQYLKKKGIDKEKLIKAFGFDGVISSSTKIKQNEEIKNNDENNIITNINNNLIKESNEINNLNNNNDNNMFNIENNEEINKEETIKNINSIYTISDLNNNNSNNLNTNANTVSSNNKKLPSIEEKQEEANSDDNQILSLLHVFVKNLEAHGITKEKISQKIEEISKLFENKEEVTKEEFIEPFSKMFIETMEITQEKDIELINNFLNDLVDSLNGETIMIFNGLLEVFDNIKDYAQINKDLEVSFELNKYKPQLINKLRQYDINNNHIIDFDIFRKIVQDLNLVLEDESMEYLIYQMKKNAPKNSSIFDLNYEIIEKLVEKNEIAEIFKNIKNSLINNKTNIDKECQEFLNTVEYQELKFLIIKRNDFFSLLDKFNISMSEEQKNSIYELFKIDIENDKNGQQNWMEYDKLKNELE